MEITKDHITAINHAKKNGFDTATFLRVWGDYSVYIAEDTGSNGDTITGYPFFILTSKGIAKTADQNETFSIMGLTFSEKDESDSLE